MPPKTNNIGLPEALYAFDIPGALADCIPYGSGHINDTYMTTFRCGDSSRRYIFQRMNKTVFTKPVELMENVVNVTSYLKKAIEAAGGDPLRETLNIIPTKDGHHFYTDSFGEYWRVYHFIEDTFSFDAVKNPRDFFQSALAFGNFQRLLADYPADTLHETIPDFHDTRKRFEAFKKAVQDDICGRASGVQEEIDFILSRKDTACALGSLQASGALPLRVTHNDTKLNNVLIDRYTGKGICVIDLDTVMPGLAVNDFGDSIRFGASTAAEDETDLSRVSCSLELFDIYTRGFIQGCGGRLTEKEMECLPLGAMVMTFECGIRFLTDYLCGDTYFKIHRPDHNLDRCRTQLKLVADMEQKWQEMREIVKKYTL